MAITKHTRDIQTYFDQTYFEGRVLRVEQVVEDRNWSDTMDYSDYRSTNCTYALVWLGTHNYAPRRDSRSSFAPMADHDCISDEKHRTTWNKTRDLEFHEQFAWVDCTNLFSDRTGFSLTAESDTEMGVNGEPLMWANYIAWQGHVAGVRAAARLEAEAKAAELEARKAKEAEKAAKKAAKLEAQRATVEAAMVNTPAKGTEVTVDGFTGKVFWKGTKLYRGAWRGTVGVKDSRGDVRSVDQDGRVTQIYP